MRAPSILPILFVACVGVGCDDPGEDEPPAWTVALEAGTDRGALISVWGAGPDDVWAVGGQLDDVMDSGVGSAYRRRDDAWAPVDLPAGTPLLNWVHGTSTTAWAVGNAGAALRWDGAVWTEHPTGLDVALWGCWVFGDDDVWAVGGDAFDVDTPGVITHFDGTTWTLETLPDLDRASGALFKIWAAAPDDLWVVGDAGAILHGDGSGWTQVPSGTGNDLISVWGRGPSEIVAVGGRSTATIARWDGTAWTTVEIEGVAGLNGVWMDAQGVATVVGGRGTAAIVRDAATMQMPTFENTGAGTTALHAVTGFDTDGLRLAVGGTLDRQPPYEGLVIESLATSP